MVHAPPLLQPIGPVANFQDSHRYVLSYRSYRDPSLHATTLIYRHASAPDDEAGKDWWAITGECPHLGAPLEHGAIEHGGGDIEDLGDDPYSAPIIICPWHSYDFSMDTGESSSGLRACTYAVETRDEILFVEPPGDLGDDFRLLGVRAVSEGESRKSWLLIRNVPVLTINAEFAESATLEPTPDFFTAPPKTLVAFCRLVLLTSDPDAKVALTREMVRQFRSGELKTIGTADDLPPPDEPPRPKSTVTVAPGKARRIGRGGTAETRVRLMHSLASIEQWAIDLAVDVIARFWNWRQGSEDGRTGKKLPMSFFADYLKIAEDEAKHFSLLRERMKELGETSYLPSESRPCSLGSLRRRARVEKVSFGLVEATVLTELALQGPLTATSRCTAVYGSRRGRPHTISSLASPSSVWYTKRADSTRILERSSGVAPPEMSKRPICSRSFTTTS